MTNAPSRDAASSDEPTCAPGHAARRPSLPRPAAQCGTTRPASTRMLPPHATSRRANAAGAPLLRPALLAGRLTRLHLPRSAHRPSAPIKGPPAPPSRSTTTIPNSQHHHSPSPPPRAPATAEIPSPQRHNPNQGGHRDPQDPLLLFPSDPGRLQALQRCPMPAATPRRGQDDPGHLRSSCGRESTPRAALSLSPHSPSADELPGRRPRAVAGAPASSPVLREGRGEKNGQFCP